MKAKGKKRQRNIFRRTTILAMIVAFVIGFLAWLIISRLERGVLDVCAMQQDAYVQLVLDQINLSADRNDEEIIDDILGTLDSSSSKYWVFSKGESMLFVKDVVETNKYKGFTTATYYDSPSAKEFLDSLSLNHVRHGTIEIDGKSYIISGVAYSYGGEEYRLCLLTNRTIMLENNAYLRVKSELWVLVLALLLLLIAIPAAYAQKIDTLRREIANNEQTISDLNRGLTKMNDLFANRDWYDTERSLWQFSTLTTFVQRIIQKGFSTVIVAHICCAQEEDREFFLNRAHLTIKKETLRFSGPGNDLILLFVNTEEDEAWLSIVPLLRPGVTLDRRLTVAHTGEELTAAVQKLSEAKVEA